MLTTLAIFGGRCGCPAVHQWFYRVCSTDHRPRVHEVDAALGGGTQTLQAPGVKENRGRMKPYCGVDHVYQVHPTPKVSFQIMWSPHFMWISHVFLNILGLVGDGESHCLPPFPDTTKSCCLVNTPHYTPMIVSINISFGLL